MRVKLATWYMEWAWIRIGNLRNIKFFHRLFNRSIGIRKDQYIAQVLVLAYQRVRV